MMGKRNQGRDSDEKRSSGSDAKDNQVRKTLFMVRENGVREPGEHAMTRKGYEDHDCMACA